MDSKSEGPVPQRRVLRLKSLSVARREIFGETESQRKYRECMEQFEERIREALRKKYQRTTT
jgi:hypothetical protein